MDEPGVVRKVWLFSMVLGHSRWPWGRFCSNQNLQTVLRSHIAAFDAIDGVPSEVLYDRMKTAVIGEDGDGTVTYNRSLVALLNHYGAVPRACKPYRAKTKGKVERPFRYIRQDFFLARTFRNIGDLNAQFEDWRTQIADPRVHATTGRIVEEAFVSGQPSLSALPLVPCNAVLMVERCVDPARRKAPRQTRPPIRGSTCRKGLWPITGPWETAWRRRETHDDLGAG